MLFLPPSRHLDRLAAALLLAAGIFAASATRAAVFSPETFTLANGLQVVVIVNRRAPVVTQMVWYKVGAADEERGKSGIAHFLEHLMFKGTPSVPPGQFSKQVARAGGRDNAFTSNDYTAFFQNIARDRLELVMKLESDRMANLALTDAEVLPEREVVLEERRMRTDNEPAALLNEQVQASLFLHHPYRIPVIGWAHEIKNLGTEDALAFYRRWYAPNNAILVVAGDIDAAELKPLAEKYFGAIPSRPVPERIRVQEPPAEAARRVIFKDEEVRQPNWSRTYIAPSHHTDGHRADALDVLEEVLGGGATSRLYRALVVNSKLAANAGCDYQGEMLDSGRFMLFATPSKDVPMDKIEAAMDAEIASFLKDGPSDDEINRAKNRLVSEAIYARDSLQGGARTLGMALSTGQTIEDVETWPDRINAVTAEQVREAAQAVLLPKASVTGLLLPPDGRKVAAEDSAPLPKRPSNELH